jgi:hypothetical protein
MSIIIVRLLAAAFLGAIFVGHANAQARNEFTIINQTEYRIIDIRTANHNEKSWHHVNDFSGIKSGGSTTIDFSHPKGPCLVDISIKFDDDSDWWDWNPGFNFCDDSQLTVSWNYQTHKFHIEAR